MGIGSLLYEKDKSRIAGYERRIDEILGAEERLIASLGDTGMSADELELVLIGIKRQKNECERLLTRIREDMAALTGEYLSATAVYEATAAGILERLAGMEGAIDDALRGRSIAEAAGETGDLIRTLRSFAEVISGEKQL